MYFIFIVKDVYFFKFNIVSSSMKYNSLHLNKSWYN